MTGRLKTDGRLKAMLVAHYRDAFLARRRRRPVAWVTSGAPVELLHALGILPVYPENFAAVAASRHLAVELCEAAEAAGYSPDLCSYARTSIGSMLTGQGPLKGKALPEPDLLFAASNICGVVVKWWEVVARHYRVPLFILDFPFVSERLTAHQVDYVRRQLEEAIAFLQAQTGRQLTRGALAARLRLSAEAVALWNQVQLCRRAAPCPVGALDAFTNLFPMVTLRGTRACVDYLRRLCREVEGRVARGEGAVQGERYRLIWDNIAIWHAFGLIRYLHSRGASFVGETYTWAWGEYEFGPEDLHDPLGSLATQYSQVILNIDLGRRLERLLHMVKGQRADGVLFHSCRSCKTYSLGQLPLAREIGNRLAVPSLLLEADMADARAYSEGQARTRVDAFLEVLDSRRNGSCRASG
ncbi:MAG: 2-hydroxyacyl-CoA dehydratase family protein [bacterium]|nr:2-hydroxyacyl-CoA dehydratase family protein [bacterium]